MFNTKMLYKPIRMLRPRMLMLQIKCPPRIGFCAICRCDTIHVRTDQAPRIGTRCLRCQSTAHHRGVWSVIVELFGADLSGLRGRAVYEISHHGALFNAFSRAQAAVPFTLQSSEFDDHAPTGIASNGVRNENIERLSFPDASFALVTSTGLMEHVEDDAAGFREVYRCLEPGGFYVFTVPLNYIRERTTIRANRENCGCIRNLLEPEYHDDPFRGTGGVFTWRNYGTLDLLRSLREAGFNAHIKAADLPLIPEHMPVVVASKPVTP